MRLFFVVFILLLFFSCDRYKDDGLHVTGKIGEILVVCENAIWQEEDTKEALDSAFTRFLMPYFPDVPTFELIHKTNKSFDGAIKRHRNVLFLNENTSLKVPCEVNRVTDGWADQQTIFEINFQKKNDLIAFLKKPIIKLVHDQYAEEEWKRILAHLEEQENEFTLNTIKENFQIEIDLPEGSGIVTKRPNFYRIEFPPSTRPIDFVNVKKQDLGNIWQGLMIYQYDFVDSSQFELENLLKARDTMLMYNVPHETKGLYMGTQYNKIVYPEINWSTNAKETIQGVEMRGMFVFVGKPIHTTGGAFWAFHFLHPKTRKIICLSGYLDAPSTTTWIHFLRELQAVWKSVRLYE
jgi:hypothetical protein